MNNMKTTKPELKVANAQAIIDLADGMKRLNNSRLNKRAIILLLRDATGLGKRETLDGSASSTAKHILKIG